MYFHSVLRAVRFFTVSLLTSLFLAAAPLCAQDSLADDGALRARLASDSFFSGYRWERVGLGPGTSEASFIVLWDALDTAVDAETNPRLLGRIGGWLRAQAKTAQDANCLPETFKAGLLRQVVPIVILRSRAHYERWQVDHPSLEYRGVAGTYDPELGALICHMEKRGIGESANDLRNFILHLHARQLITQTAPQLTNSSAQWILVGLSDLLSTAASSKAKEIVKPYIYRQGLRNVIKVLNDYKDRQKYWIGPKSLLAVQGAKQRLRLPIDMKTAGHSRTTLWNLLYYFDQESMLWVHFLLARENGEEALAACVQDALKAPLGVEAAVQHMGFAHVQAAEKAMLVWLDKIAKPVGGVALKKAVDSKKAASTRAKGSKKAPKNASVDPPKKKEPAKLVLQPFSGEQTVKYALYLASQARFDEALSALKNAEEPIADSAAIKSESERLEALLKARDGFLAAAIKEGKKLRFTHGGKRVLVKPVAWKDGILELKPSSKCSLPRLENEQLGPGFLALNWKKLPASLGPDWLFGYVSFLSADPKWLRALRDTDNNPGEDLSAHGDWAPTGKLIEFLTQAKQEKATGLGSAELAELCTTFAGGMEFTDSESFFRAAIQRELQVTSAKKQVEDFVNTVPQTLPDGSMRLKYTFDDEVQLEDFVALKKLWEESRMYPDEPFPEDQEPASIDEGAFTFSGERRFAHRFSWEGPVRLIYTFELVNTDAEDLSYFLFFGLRVASDGSWVRSDFHTLWTRQSSRSKRRRVKGSGVSLAFDRLFEGALAWDGKKASLEFEDQSVLEADFALGGGGSVVIWSQSEYPIRIHELTIEGTPAPDSLVLERDKWVAGQMKSLGFSAEDDGN